ncbi:hypothetical protein C2E23DRAFT_883188 [Lenzites betulinus]|nr:hypothetical protein C2E23DRAFT_883188 [Lenzites betulinus]
MTANAPLSPLLRLPVELTTMITSQCDLPSLITLRKTCRAFYLHANAVLLSDQRSLALHYVTNPDEFWSVLGETRSVVGGFGALSFLLRDKSVRPKDLEIFAPASLAAQLVIQMQNIDELSLTVRTVRVHKHHYRTLPFHVSRATTLVATHDRTITIYAFTSDSPLQPIARSPTSALINWVSADAFACGYPTLTLLRRTLGRFPEASEEDLHALYKELLHNDFKVASEPFLWPEYTHLSTPSDPPWLFPCLRSLHLCPDQSRYFGDAGSLQTVFNLLDFDEHTLRRQQRPPYGLTVAWRLDSTRRTCTELCLLYDPILPNHVFSSPVFIMDKHDFL